MGWYLSIVNWAILNMRGLSCAMRKLSYFKHAGVLHWLSFYSHFCEFLRFSHKWIHVTITYWYLTFVIQYFLLIVKNCHLKLPNSSWENITMKWKCESVKRAQEQRSVPVNKKYKMHTPFSKGLWWLLVSSS